MSENKDFGIYEINEDLVKILVKNKKISEYSAIFNKKLKNDEKVNYLEELLDKFGQYKKLEHKVVKCHSKNDEKSQIFRQEGNKYFSLKNNDYFKAIELYNKSICFAHPESENISIGYANRSAVFFELKLFEDCLESIRLAKEAKCPKKLEEKLEKRAKKCIEFSTSKTSDTQFDLTLSYEKNSKIPYIVDCLKMGSSEENGRYIYTERNLMPGDLVAIEEPFCSALLPLQKYLRCANCNKENNHNLIPCPNCTSAMFCNKNCMYEAISGFHKFECPLIDLLFAIFSKMHLIAIRTVLTSISLWNNNMNEFLEFFENPANKNQNIFSIDLTKNSKIEKLKAILGLVTNQEKRDTGDLFQRATIAAVLKRYFLKYTQLGSILKDEKHKNLFANLLLHNLQTSASNMHSIDTLTLSADPLIVNEIATAAYCFSSLLNHSCAPNIFRGYRGTTTLYMFIARPINAGGLLYDNYGYHYAIFPKSIRLKHLETQYRFKCDCEACRSDYKLFENLSLNTEIPNLITENDIKLLMAFNKEFAYSNYKRYCKFLEEYDKFYPCHEIACVEESLKRALDIIIESIPIKIKFQSQKF